MKNIVIIQHEPLTQRTQKIFYINELLSAGFKVEYWNMSQYFHPGISLLDEVKENYCIEINSLKALQNKLQQTEVSSTLFIVETFDCWENRHFFKMLKEKKCFTIRIDLYANSLLPMRNWKRYLSFGCKDWFKFFKNKFQNIQYRCYKKCYKFQEFDVIMTSFTKLHCKGFPYIAINHPDYDAAMKNKEQISSLCDTHYAVFLDEFFPWHPDYMYVEKILPDKSVSKIYLNKICSFFSEIERMQDVKVVVALHPKSTYKSEDFGGRLTLRNKTQELVRFSKFVIFHGSSAISYAAIYKRPGIAVYYPEYKKLWKEMYNFGKVTSKTLGFPHVEINDKIIHMPSPTINLELSENYIYSYITCKQNETNNNKDIIINYLKKL